MEMIKGKYADAKVFAEDLEQYARVQLQMICDDPVAEGSVIRVMPDVHPGKVGTVGLTMTIGSRVIPNLLGVDMGCGMSCMQIKEKRLEYQKLDKVIRENIPTGFEVRKQPYHLAEEMAEKLGQLHCHKHINIEKNTGKSGAFVLDYRLYLYEHQSTYNPNMPLRDLFYVSNEYQKLIGDKKSLYASKVVKIPAPRFIVFYNGTAKDRSGSG